MPAAGLPVTGPQVTEPPADGTAPPPGKAKTPLTGRAAMLQRWEIVAVLAVSLGASGVYALVDFIGSLTAKQSLGSQAVVLNGTPARAARCSPCSCSSPASPSA